MSYIGINSMDLSLLSNDIKEIEGKINEVKELLDSKYESVKEMNVYDNGFKNIYEYLEQELLVLTDVKTKIEKYQSDILEVENKYDRLFDSIVVPNIVSNSSNLTVATTVSNPVEVVNIVTNNNIETKENKTVEVKETSKIENNTEPPKQVSNPVEDVNIVTNNNIETKENKTVEVKETSKIENNTEPPKQVSNNSVEDSKEEKVVINEVNTDGEKSKTNGSNVFGILAGAVGAAGAIGAGALAAAQLKSKDDEEKKEENNNTEYSNVVKEY